MKIGIRLAIFFSLLMGAGFFIVPAHAESNPYMPSPGRGSPGVIYTPLPDLTQQQQAMQSLLSGQSPDPASGNASIPQQQAAPPAVTSADLQQLRDQQASDAAAVAREVTDRETQIRALKDAFDNQIHEMQRKIDKMQQQLDDMQYKNHL